MAPRPGCLILSLFLIASARVILVEAECGEKPAVPCDIGEASVCAGCTGFNPVPNPLDCNSYYICNSEAYFTPEPILCPDGEVFDKTEKKCVPDDGKCTPYCDKPGGGACIYSCNAADVKVADPFDCGTFHICADDGNGNFEPGSAETCTADKPYFDGEGCGVDESACCHCHPYCYDGDVMVEDPTDCQMYFLCTAADEVPTFQGACGKGEYFDLHAQKCSSTAPCVTLCRNVVDQDGCIDPYTCQEKGYFPKCKTQCLRDFYHCLEVSDDYAVPERCPDDLVFNPDTLTCVKNETCPYNNYYE